MVFDNELLTHQFDRNNGGLYRCGTRLVQISKVKHHLKMGITYEMHHTEGMILPLCT